MGDDPGFAAARAGQDQQRPLQVRYRLALGLGESVQQCIHVSVGLKYRRTSQAGDWPIATLGHTTQNRRNCYTTIPATGRTCRRRRFHSVTRLGREPMSTRIPLRTTDTKAKDLADKLDMSTAEIGLSVRTTNCLEERGIFTVNDLLHCTRDDLLSISNFGEKTLEEVYKALEGIGFHRRGKREPVADASLSPSLA